MNHVHGWLAVCRITENSACNGRARLDAPIPIWAKLARTGLSCFAASGMHFLKPSSPNLPDQYSVILPFLMGLRPEKLHLR